MPDDGPDPADRRPRRPRTAAGVVVVGLIALVSVGLRLGAEPGFADEWAYVSQAYFGPLWWEGRWDDPAWIEYPAVDLPRLRGTNPVRRDVTMLPAGGWLLLAFKTDNPGAWLFHCHIAWHVSGGLSVDFLERPADLAQQISTADRNDFNRVCNEWRTYWPTNPYPKIDSGLKQRFVEESEWLVRA